MTDTTRDLIQRMADALEALQKEAVTTPHNQTIVVGGVAHPIPIGNDLLARDALHAHLLDRARAYLAQAEPEEPTVMEIIALADEIEAEELGQVDLVRRALARWGRPAVEPVPVSKRLPGEEDCDPSFQCWWFTPSEEKWILWPIKWAGPECSHWLPHYALPVPTTETP